MPSGAELRFHRFRAALRSLVRESRHVNRTLRATLREASQFFEADAGCIAVYRPGARKAEVRVTLGKGGGWSRKLLTAILRRESPKLPPRFRYGLLHRRGRVWGLLALRRADDSPENTPRADFERWHLAALQETANTVSELIQDIDRRLLADVRERIDKKIMDRLRPRDLFYQILDGLRSLTRYDHSAAILVMRPSGTHLEIAAEQIAWRKDVSRRIGQRLPLSAAAIKVMARGSVHGFRRESDGWKEWKLHDGDVLAELLDYNRDADPDAFRREEGMIAAPLATRAGVIGVLKVAATHPDGLGPYEAELIRRFLPQVAVAMQRSELKRSEQSLQAQVLVAERRGAMATLARGVAHDVNNTLGGVLLGVQQARSELGDETADPERAERMLARAEQGIHACRRIFGGMLAFARGQARAKGRVLVDRALKEALGLHETRIERRGIRVDIEIEANLPVVSGRQTDLDQIFMNLVANALDAMGAEGTLRIRAARVGVDGRNIAVMIQDDGEGIPPDALERIQDAFFTTKEEGHGLGLAIVRSLLTDMAGVLSVDSKVGAGTTVTVTLPILRDDAPGAA